MNKVLTVVALSLLFVGCSGSVEERTPVEPELIGEDDEEEGPYSINRSEYEEVLKSPPNTIFLWYMVVPAYKTGSKVEFVGWEVVDIYKLELKKGPIRKGDVVVRINKSPIERPEQVMKVWRELWGRKTLDIELFRSGQKKIYSIPIVDDSK